MVCKNKTLPHCLARVNPSRHDSCLVEAPSSQALPSFPPLAVCEESLGTRVVQRYLYRIVNNWLVFIGGVVHCCVAMITVSKNRRKNAINNFSYCIWLQ